LRGVDGGVGEEGADRGGVALFDGVGAGHAAGVWEETPRDRPEFKARYAKTMQAARAAEEAVGT
jgi:chlorophyllide a reductase subunit Y